MRADFHQRLNELGTTLVAMCGVSADILAAANAAFNDTDPIAADRAIAQSKRLTDMREPAESQAMSLLTLQAPVGRDLRQVVVSIHLIGDLVRMGQLARHVAEIVHRNHPVESAGAGRPILTRMGQAALELATTARRALVAQDPETAAAIDIGDELIDSLAAELATVLTTDSEVAVPEAVDAILLCRFYERYGDHAVAVGRRIAFLATGAFPEVDRPNHPRPGGAAT
ncbi:phosphate signaling complex PhoU family protein [Tsukamurella ocularis]|uniref:phosphate signaling complex PhoU family protein n=1 Tax=Tsukamurella ocularis TaxID=1970234 RepID=UPI00216A0076|nr:PhoU domain-containing protein [Tsukamurella ocularis]MCS3779023.1 phosphate transport system protein [Tsukamurella ocularis]MCS3787357.1 phosphate transport system protein [Tsukamurella ocularis]MCS3851706.1 phosphate transport system protein [Tsukamurella ocularis]